MGKKYIELGENKSVIAVYDFEVFPPPPGAIEITQEQFDKMHDDPDGLGCYEFLAGRLLKNEASAADIAKNKAHAVLSDSVRRMVQTGGEDCTALLQLAKGFRLLCRMAVGDQLTTAELDTLAAISDSLQGLEDLDNQRISIAARIDAGEIIEIMPPRQAKPNN